MPWAEKFGKTLSYPSLEIKTINGETLTGDWSAGGTITTENGNTVITPPEWSSKAVAPGDTLTFTLKSGKGTASLSNIQSVTLRQKAVSSGSIISRNVLYENNESGVVETTTEKVTTTKAPETTNETTQATTVPEVPVTTAPEQTTTKKASTGAYPEWSPNSVLYNIGDLVQYQGNVYECTFAHTSNSGWTPTEAFTLWKLRSDLVAGEIETTTKGGSSVEETTTVENNYTVNSKLPQHMVTGYWHNFLNGSTALTRTRL